MHAYMVGAASGPDRRRRSTASSGAGRRSPCCRSSTSTARGGATSYFSDGLVEDIIAALACLPELVVISRTSTLRYRGSAPGSAPDPPRSARALHAVRQRAPGRRQGAAVGRAGGLRERRHHLERPLRRRRRRSVRAAGRAVGAGGGDDHAAGAGGRAAPRAAQAAGEPRRLRMRACAGSTCSTASRTTSSSQALPLFQRAMALDPNYATAHALAASWYSVRIGQGSRPSVVADLREADRLARLALTLDRFDPRALSLCGHVRALLFRDYDHAIELFDRALAANPSSAIAWMRSSATFSYMGETREARRRADIGLRLSPYDAHVFYSYATGGARELRRRRLWRRGRVGAQVGGAQSALHGQPALPRRQPRGERPDRRGAPGLGRRCCASIPSSAPARFAEGHALRDPDTAPAVRRSSRAGRAAGVGPELIAGSAHYLHVILSVAKDLIAACNRHEILRYAQGGGYSARDDGVLP